MTTAERLAIKPQRNAPCPCGQLFTREVQTTEGLKKLQMPKKYKHCYLGKSLFYDSKEAKELAELDIKRRSLHD
jgi:hypothetical protein